ncbi:unnamed protein product [Vicia faba]|uniref:Isopenicillin N synthase-like Fe(2+) 2OG dioxygenase domain-containing protein n=1 Tax=Vicia faba TaxID=3906 RepID=A0AAV0ZRR6_VICFA|nr:unnamed protein product [Vicia faba]
MWSKGNPNFCETLSSLISKTRELSLFILKMVVEGFGLPEKGTMAIIFHNEVQGLQVLTKSGNWANVNIPPNGFIVLVGGMLKAWSNGRIQAPKHRVVTRGDKERLSFILFAVPNQETLIKVPSELVNEDHPLRYKPFKYEPRS